jgi:hypothetical protein
MRHPDRQTGKNTGQRHRLRGQRIEREGNNPFPSWGLQRKPAAGVRRVKDFFARSRLEISPGTQFSKFNNGTRTGSKGVRHNMEDEDTLDRLIHARSEAYRAALTVDFRDGSPATQRWRDLNRQYVVLRNRMRRANQPLPDRTCDVCGTSIEHRRASARFCSDACRKAFQRAA